MYILNKNEDNNVDNNQHVNTTSDDEFAALTLPELEAARDDILRRLGRCTMLGSNYIPIHK